jgi:hypothetical protein
MDEHARTTAGLVRRMEMANSTHLGVGRCKHIIGHDAAELMGSAEEFPWHCLFLH